MDKTKEQKPDDLKKIIIQLESSEQQLKALNQQLLANEQQLRAANQQLVASEITLKNEKQFSESLLETANTIILTLDVDANITLFNKFAEELTGYTKEEVLGRNWFDLFISKNNGSAVPKVFHDVLKQLPDVSSYTNSILCNDGTERLINWGNTIIRNDNGEIKGILSIGNDITERKRAKESLHESEERFRTLVEQSTAAIEIYDPNGKLLIVNDAWSKFWNLKKETISDFNILTDPQCKRTGLTAAFKMAQQGISEMLPDILYDAEESDFCGGRKLWISSRMYPIKDADGKVQNIVFTYDDITERKQAEQMVVQKNEQFELILQGGNLGWWDWDIPSGDEIYNENLTKNLGYELSEVKPHVSWWEDKIHPDDYSYVSRDLQSIFDRKKEYYENKHRLKTKTGEWKWFIDYGKVVEWSENGKPLRMIGILQDIDKLERSVETLRESEETYRNIFNNAQVGLFRTRIKDGKLLEVNNALAKMSGYDSREQYIKEYDPVKEYVDDGTRERMIKEITSAGYVNNFEARFYNRDGSIMWASFSAKIFPNKGWIEGVLEDVTDRKKSEAALRESEEKYRLITTNTLDTIWTTDLNFNITFVNNAIVNFLGYNPEEFTGLNPSIFTTDEGLIILQNEAEQLVARYKEGDAIQNIFEVQQIKKDGSIIDVEIRANVLLDNKKNLVGFQGRSVDISIRKKSEAALRESEEKYREMANMLPQVVYETDINGNLTFINEYALDIFGYSQAEFAKGVNILQTLVPEEVDRAKQNFHNVLIGIDEDDPEYIAMRKDGTIFPILIYANTIIKDNVPVGLRGIIVDITERKKAEKALSEKTLMLDNILKSSVDMAIATTDLDFRITYFNPIAETFFGYSSQEVIGKTVHEMHIMENVENERLEKAIASVHRNGEYKYFVEQKTKDGIRYLESRVSGIYDSDNNILGYALFSSNITKRKRAEDEIQKLSTAVHQSPSVIAITNIKGNLEYVNPKFTELTGYTLDEAKGLNPRVLKSGEQPDEMYKELWQTISSSKEWHGEFHNKKKNGELFWESASVSAIFDKKGKITNYIKVAEDISERKRIEESQKIILEISQIADENTTLQSFLASVHKKINKIIRAKNLYIAIYDKEIDTYTFPYHKDEIDIIEPNKSYSLGNGYTDFVRKTGKTKLITVNSRTEVLDSNIVGYGETPSAWLGVPLKNEHYDEVIGVITIQDYNNITDYTEFEIATFEIVANNISKFIQRIKYLEDLKFALEKATESERLKTAFLNNFSHEIRTPMNGILGFINLLKLPNLTGVEQQRYINVIESSSARMLVTVDDLVNISMIEAGQMKVSNSEINIIKKTKDIETLLGIEARKKGFQLLLKNSLPANEAYIITDDAKIYAILTNLVKNAIKFTHEGSVKFGLTKKGDNLEFFVEDTGIGIPNDRQKAIFDRFVKADIEDKDVFEGSGLGLTIAKAYVEMLGGNIWLESEEGIGTKFYFTIPYNPVKKELTISNDETLNVKSASSSKDLTILIVEDEEEVTEYLSIILSDLSTSLLYSTNGFDAVEICRNNPNIDLILMDIKMPIMGGYKAIEQIRKFNKDVIIIAQTAYALKGDHEKAIEAGCNDYISKPIDKDKLIEMIEKWFEVLG